MSAFLGPIHVKMYERILYQDTMSQALLDFAAGKGWAVGLGDKVATQAPAASRQPLEAIIDESNIHGWLSDAVVRCERRFAMIACGILTENPERIGELLPIMNALGKAQNFSPAMDAERAFQTIHDVLLDGMPCDFPFDVTESGVDTVTWRVTNCPHAPYWADNGCGVEGYYQLRDAWVQGALENSGITHTRTELYAHTLEANKHGQH